MHRELKTAPTSTVLSVEDAKTHLRVDGNDEDDYISGLVAGATLAVERHCDRALLTQTWVVSLDRFPPGDRPLSLPLPPLRSVAALTYIDAAGTERGLADYQTSKRSPAIVAPAPGKVWPTTSTCLDAVRIEIEVGYGDAGTDVPPPVRHAILLLVAHWYENREPVTVGGGVNDLPFTVDALLAPYSVWSIA